MKKKIYMYFCLVGGVSIVVTALLCVLTFYNIFQKQVIEDLSGYASIIMESKYCDLDNLEDCNWAIEHLRITLLDTDGMVIYDNNVNADILDNHKERPEIVEALEKGTGSAIRQSATLNETTYYYAVRLEDNKILRVAQEGEGILNLFMSAFPLIGFITIILMMCCVTLSKMLTLHIVSPIEKMAGNMRNIKKYMVYDELIPFATMISKQHKDIREQMDYLGQENTKMQMITDYMAEGLLLIDAEKNIIIANPSAKHLLSQREVDYSGRNILHLSRNEELNRCISEALMGKKQEADFELHGVPLQVYANPVYNDENLIGVMCFIVDMSEKQKGEKMRREFTANVSHELKTPLTAISGYAELISENMTSPDATIRFAKEIHHNAKRLLALINDIIKLSELDEVELVKSYTTFDLMEIAKQVETNLEMNLSKAQVSLFVEGESCELYAQREMIEQVVYNLTSNAVRYNHIGGKVWIRIHKQGDQAVLCVEDTGIGIPKAHQERIFERFYRVDKSRSKATGGTGLGLAIVKHVLSHHHASIVLESEEDKGTKITVTFPIKQSSLEK